MKTSTFSEHCEVHKTAEPQLTLITSPSAATPTIGNAIANRSSRKVLNSPLAMLTFGVLVFGFYVLMHWPHSKKNRLALLSPSEAQILALQQAFENESSGSSFCSLERYKTPPNVRCEALECVVKFWPKEDPKRCGTVVVSLNRQTYTAQILRNPPANSAFSPMNSLKQVAVKPI